MNISYSYSPALITHTEFSIARSCTKKGNYVIMKLKKLKKPEATLFFYSVFQPQNYSQELDMFPYQIYF